MSGHAFLPGLFAVGFAIFVPAITAFVKKRPAARRPILLAGSLLWIGFGLALTRLYANIPGGAVTGWIWAIPGAVFLFVAGPGWRNFRPLEQDEDDAVVKPTPNRPLRHFGETS